MSEDKHDTAAVRELTNIYKLHSKRNTSRLVKVPCPRRTRKEARATVNLIRCMGAGVVG